MATAGRSPEIPDPYVGKVYGNILDMYDNPSYNIKLYMIPVASAGTTSGSTTGSADTAGAARSDTASTAGNSTKKDIKAVVIAQTGVTGNIIDDLEINAKPDTQNGFIQTSAKFRIFQPGAANLLDQIAAADKFLGNQVTTQPIVYLAITFKGYNHDPDNNDNGGEPQTIVGPITYKANLNRINVRIDNTGSTYDCEATLENVTAFHDVNYRVPAALDSVGKTITEHVRDFEAKLNKYYQGIATTYERPDEIKFDLSNLVGGGSQAASFEGGETLKISDETLTSGNDKDAEDINRAWTNLTNETVEDEQANAEDPPSNAGRSDIIVEGDKISIKEGITFERYFFILLSMNKEFLNMITRKSNFSDPSDTAVNKAKTFIAWMRMNATVEELQWDKNRGAYTKRITYKPTLYNTGRSDVALTVDEINQAADVNAATVKLGNYYKSGKLLKSYYYLFTGHNDQIINLDIAYDGAQALIVPPKGGALGDVSITSAVALNSTVDETADASGKSLFDKAKNAANKAKFGDLLSSIKDNINSVTAIAGTIGRTTQDLQGILNNPADREALVRTLDTRTINRVASSAVMSNTSASDTDAPTAANPSGTKYTPEISGFTYAEDLVMASDAIDVSDLRNASGSADIDLRYQVVGTSTVPNVAEAATYVTTNPGNTLFGYVYQQHSSTAFLNRVNMTIRGDPWYLGKKAGESNLSEKSTPTAMSFTGDDNHFLLQISTAKAFDPDVSDEDSGANSGFWKFDGMSNAFSGVYKIIEIKNNFRNGVFTVDIFGAKDFAVPLSKIRRARVGETVPDLTSIAGYDAAAQTIGTPADTGETPGSTPSTPGTTGGNSQPNPGQALQPGLVGAPPQPSGPFRGAESLSGVRDWLQAQGARVDENALFPGDWNPNAHKGLGHAQNRAFDVNLVGGFDATHPTAGPKMDKIAAALKAQGWSVTWRSKGHYNHLHVEYPQYLGIQRTGP